MAMPNPKEELTLHQIIKAADKLPTEEQGQLIRHLEFRSWDEAWNRLAKELNEKRAAKGLPPATDEDIHAEIDAHRTPEEIATLKHEIQESIDSLERGEGIPAEQVFAELEERYKNFRKGRNVTKLIVSPKARQDLLDIGDYIAHNNPVAAASFVARLKQCCLEIAQHPRIGRKRDNLQPGLRSLAEGHYLILFSHNTADNIVEIHHIVHGRRKLEKIFK